MEVTESTKPEEKGKVTRWTGWDDEGRSGDIVYVHGEPGRMSATEQLYVEVKRPDGRVHREEIRSFDYALAREMLRVALKELPSKREPEPEPESAAQEPEDKAVEWAVEVHRGLSSVTTLWVAAMGERDRLHVERIQYQDDEEWGASYWRGSQKEPRKAKPIPVGHRSPEAAKAWALQWVREGAQTVEQPSESDETELVPEPVPAPRGRVVARWERVGDDTSRLLVSKDFEVWVFKRTPRHWIADVKLCNRSAYSAYDRADDSVASAVAWIRSFVAPFGGELVVEGEP